MLIVFLLTPFCVNAVEDSPEAVTAADIPVTQDAPSLSFHADAVSQLETNKLYATGFSLATVTLTMLNNPASVPDGGGMIAYRFTPVTDEQTERDDNTTLIETPGEHGNPFPVTYANESNDIKNMSAGGDTYHVKYIYQSATSDTSFDVVLGGPKKFYHPGVFRVSLDYAIYYP